MCRLEEIKRFISPIEKGYKGFILETLREGGYGYHNSDFYDLSYIKLPELFYKSYEVTCKDRSSFL